MPLFKQAVPINFARGLDTKTDPKQLAIGSFLSLENSIFTKAGLLQKRNGYAQLTGLPDTSFSYLTTFNDNLTALGPTIAAYNLSDASWLSKGTIQPLSVATLPLLRNNLNQISCDSVTAPNGLVCTVYQEFNGNASPTTVNKYVVANSVTGQNITAPAPIPVASGTVSGGMRVVFLGNNFVIVFTNTIGGTPHLQYVAVSSANPAFVTANADIAPSYQPNASLSWDVLVVGGTLYAAYSTAAGGQTIAVTAFNATGTQIAVNTTAGVSYQATSVSLAVDSTPTGPFVVYVSWIFQATTSGTFMVFDGTLNSTVAPTSLFLSTIALNITSVAQNGVCQFFYESAASTNLGTNISLDFISSVTFNPGAHTVSSPVVVLRSVGIASKAFIVNGAIYLLAAYDSPYQPTYFLVSGTSTSASPVIAGKLAYSNGGGYLTLGIPGVTVTGDMAQVSYLFKDSLQAVNKNTNVPAGSQVAGVYSQLGVNLATFTINTAGLDTAEIGNDLLISGGFLWMYDGYLPVEHNFFVWPDTATASGSPPTSPSAVWTNTGGHMAAQPTGYVSSSPTYYYQLVYEWTDNQGNAYRSAPSIPIPVVTSSTGNTGSVAIYFPTLRVTMKTANPVKLVIYRWSVDQQVYYQTTSITAPILNDPTADIIIITDTNASSTILGNNLLYTTGGVVEDVNAPASNILALFDTRLWLVDAEDPNLLWYSKQVIEATPVEMSDLFTMYVSPTQGVQGSTGPITALAPMDDKLIIFKHNAIYYVNGSGPDNTGANSQYSQASFVTSTVGCFEQNSVVLMPQGLMFQSDKGIWLLDRNLQTSYIGAPVENFNSSKVESAQNIPGTNQVRFILGSGQTLMYDYYFGQWGTFAGVPAVSACIFGNLHTFINKYGAVYQESPGLFLDGSVPVLMGFQTGPIRLGDLQNYQRAYAVYLLGEFLSPHNIMVSFSYDYAPTPSQSAILHPINYSTPYGVGPSQSPYGQGNPYGGPLSLEQFRVFLQIQRCQAVSMTFQEVYDASFGVPAGGGLTLSGLSVLLGFKSKWPTVSAAQTFGQQ